MEGHKNSHYIYKGEIEHPFFQKEVDEMDMSVSLGLVFDSNMIRQECL